MENANILSETTSLNDVQVLLATEYGLTEPDISKMHLILFQKLMEINNRIKKLEEHFLVSVIHENM